MNSGLCDLNTVTSIQFQFNILFERVQLHKTDKLFKIKTYVYGIYANLSDQFRGYILCIKTQTSYNNCPALNLFS